MTWPFASLSAPTSSDDRWLYLSGSNTNRTGGTTPTVTWTRPNGRGMFLFVFGGAGGGGGGGAQRFGTGQAGGGGGGGPGVVTMVLMPAIMVPEHLGLVIGAGGAGGAGGPANTTTAGSNGTAGGATSIISYAQGGTAPYVLARADGGNAGTGSPSTLAGAGAAGALATVTSATDWTSCGLMVSYAGTIGTGSQTSQPSYVSGGTLQCGGGGGGNANPNCDGSVYLGPYDTVSAGIINSVRMNASGQVFRFLSGFLHFIPGHGSKGDGTGLGTVVRAGDGGPSCGGGGGGGCDSTNSDAGTGGRGGDGFVFIAAI